MNKIKVGIIGTGYIGDSHIETIRRLGKLELTAVADVHYDLAKTKAEFFGVEKCYKSVDELIADKDIQVVHNCTPTNLHLEINEKIIRAGKHVFSEKPLGKTSAESAKMLEILKDYPDTVAGLNFCYRMNGLIQDAKNRIAAGEIGQPYLVHGSYLQDWLLYETDYNWRIEPEYTGVSRCVGDIGSHWMDLAQIMTGAKIVEVCANTVIALPVRKKPTTQVETFAVNTNQDYEEVKVETEDYAGVLLKFDNGASGIFQCSEISAGRKCFIDIEIDGSAASFQWNQQISDQMWKGHRDRNNEQIMRNPNIMTAQAKKYTHLAAGHPEGWNDAFKNNLDAYYGFIMEGKKMGKDPCDFATFKEGHYLMRLTEAIIKSGKERRWISLDEV
ncbi:MAG: Gfo/Idh/MocA family oxidoreductase [Treponema sp.]|jgi:predicted dehydrogenase|nr:Gfo/Idh/MocA family oxidoreductase [Treponema sp.]